MANALYFGDNLDVLRESVKDESVDLIYLDPPFNSSATYNVLFKSPKGHQSDAQIEVFDDTWHWGEHAEAAFADLMHQVNTEVAEVVRALRSVLGENDMMAYLTMMAIRLLELHRVLKITGGLYLHCDATASHYLKIVLDQVFCAENYRNEIIWKRQSAHSDATSKFPAVSDTIFFYVRSKDAKFHPQYAEHDPEYLEKFYRFDDGDGRGLYRLGDMAAPKGGGMAAINKKTGKPNGWHIWKGFSVPATGWRYSSETMARLDAEGRIHYPKKSDGTNDPEKRLALKRYLEEQKGSIVTNIWSDIPSLSASA